MPIHGILGRGDPRPQPSIRATRRIMDHRKIDVEVLRELLEAHRQWVSSEGRSGKRADLSRTDLSWADLTAARLAGADLSEADLFHADLAGASLEKAVLRGAKLACVSMPEANLQGADLTDADLFLADAVSADLEGANLERANLFGATLQGVNFCRVQARGACLQGADLTGATLDEADLTGADVAGLIWGPLQTPHDADRDRMNIPSRPEAASTSRRPAGQRRLPPERRRLKVVELLRSGRKTREIAALLRVSISTIRRDKRTLFDEIQHVGVCPLCRQRLSAPPPSLPSRPGDRVVPSGVIERSPQGRHGPAAHGARDRSGSTATGW